MVLGGYGPGYTELKEVEVVRHHSTCRGAIRSPSCLTVIPALDGDVSSSWVSVELEASIRIYFILGEQIAHIILVLAAIILLLLLKFHQNLIKEKLFFF